MTIRADYAVFAREHNLAGKPLRVRVERRSVGDGDFAVLEVTVNREEMFCLYVENDQLTDFPNYDNKGDTGSE